MIRNKLNKRPGQSHLLDYAVLLSCLIVILAGIHAARVILAPIFMATFLAVLLLPPLRWLRSKGFSEVTSLTVVILSVLICGTAVATVIGTQLTQFARNLPTLRRDFNEKLMNYDLDLGDFIPYLKTPSSQEETVPPSGHMMRPATPVQERHRQTGPDPVPSAKSSSGTMFIPVAYVNPESSVNTRNVTADNPNLSTDSSNAAPNESSGTKSPAPSGTPAKSSHVETNEMIDLPRGFFDPTPLDVRRPGADHTSGTSSEHSEKTSEEKEYPDNWVKPSDAVEVSSQELFKFVAGLTGELSVLASSAFIIMLLVIFMLLEASKLPDKIARALSNRTFTSERLRQVTNDIRRYMLIKTFVSILVGICVTILLVATGVQYPFLWGFVAFLLNFIPNIGSVVAAIPPILLAMSQQGLFIGCVNIFFFLVINCGIGYLLEPKLLGDGLDLSPLVVLLSLIFCGWLLGAVGMFLSPPLAVIIKIILQSFPETRWIAVIMANRVPRELEPDPEPEHA